MHRLLERQIKSYFGKDAEIDSNWKTFLEVISDHYTNLDHERALIDNALQVNSLELQDVNEQLRKQNSESTRLMLNALNDGVYATDLEGQITFINTAAKIILHRTAKEVLGQHSSLIAHHDFPRSVPSSPFELPQNGHSTKGTSLTGKAHFSNKKGDCIPVSFRASQLIQNGTIAGLLVSFRDVSLQQAAEAQIQLQQSALDATSNIVVIVTRNGHIKYVNRAFSETTGYSSREVIEKHYRIFEPHDGDHGYHNVWEAFMEGRQWVGNVTSLLKNGSVYPEHVNITPILENGDVVNFVVIKRDITQEKIALQQIEHQANYDSLTNLPNRRMFYKKLEQEIQKAQCNNKTIALLFIDLDNFKEVNDTLGHDHGDIVLIQAAQRIRSCLRESDTVYRLGGDEFTVILPGLSEVSSVNRISQNILAKLATPYSLDKENVFISASIGITLCPDDADDVTSLLKNADQSMYAAKISGKNSYRYFTPSMQESINAKMRISNDLHIALSGQQFYMVYQPIVTLSDGSIHKAEGLIRWQHPVLGLINPADFIPIAEETNVIVDIGNWLFQQAANHVAGWQKTYDKTFQISINISPAQFNRDCIGTFSQWFSYLKDNNIQGQSIALEITEGLLLNSHDDVANQLSIFRANNISVSLDDFGTGYSSLSYLKKFNLDYIKIDKSFTKDIETSLDDMALCEAIIVMAHKLGLQVIAEGVETEVQRELLTSAGCDYGQGYLFSKPVRPEEFEILLAGSLS